MRVVVRFIRVEGVIPGKLASQDFHARVLRAGRLINKQSARGNGATRTQGTRWLCHACLMQAARSIVMLTAQTGPPTHTMPTAWSSRRYQHGRRNSYCKNLCKTHASASYSRSISYEYQVLVCGKHQNRPWTPIAYAGLTRHSPWDSRRHRDSDGTHRPRDPGGSTAARGTPEGGCTRRSACLAVLGDRGG